MIILRRLASALPSIAGVIIVTFLLTRALPGDPAAYFAGPAATQQAIEEIRHTLALVLAVAIAVPLGIAAANRPGSWIDHLCRVLATAGVSLPVFFTGLLLVYVFYYLSGWAPAPLGRLDVYFSAPPRRTGFYLIDSLLVGDVATFGAALAQLALPALTLAIFSVAPLARVTRASMLTALGSDFVRTARASGLSQGRIVYVYAFRNAVLPVITTLGMVFSFLLGASVLVEKVFAWPGIGSYDRGADRLGLRAGPGLRPEHGAVVRAAQPGDRPGLRPGRPARPADRMTETAG
jgi:peptide/nickel transport system permease protein